MVREIMVDGNCCSWMSSPSIEQILDILEFKASKKIEEIAMEGLLNNGIIFMTD